MFKLTDDGDVLMNYLNIPMSNAFFKKLVSYFAQLKG